MGWKDIVLPEFDQVPITDATTSLIVKLPDSIISAIQIRLSGTGGSGTVALDTDPTMINRIKLKTDKGYEIDLTGTHLRIIARKRTGTIPKVTNGTGAYSELVVPIYFGRKANDKALMLNLKGHATRQLELSFGTLIATTAFATGTVVLTVTLLEWVGALPSEYKGHLGYREVEDKATGTGKAIFELLFGKKLAEFLIEVVTITTVRQMTLTNRNESIQYGKMNWRDLLNKDNAESDKETAETTWACWSFFGNRYDDELVDLPDLGKVTDPRLFIERGATTTVTSLCQAELYEGS